MSYQPNAPLGDTTEDLKAWLYQELIALAESLATPVEESSEVTSLTLPALTAAPTPVVGMIVYADGSTWNPGYGEGFYGYTSTGWQFLGVVLVP